VPRYKMVVMTEPLAGREDEYNEWYQNVHLRDVVAVPGVRSARRYRLRMGVMPDPKPLPYLAIYDIESDDIEGVLKAMLDRAGSARMMISDSMSMASAFGAVFEELGPRVEAE